MDKFVSHCGSTVPLLRSNIDTDQIIPKQFLKRIERSGYGEFLFYDWRFNSSGMEIDGFVLNDDRYEDASVLIAGANFGCGSSREHAPWSLLDYGIRAVIASSFADIFYNNSLKNGLLPVVLTETEVNELARRAADPPYELFIDLETQLVADLGDFSAEFQIDP
ncbi:MAG TPA: 3-isopropylmalate dehydratase small subunit, partial [Pyrinomonadaceae bacterium]|nr:3-isopropylmalate dehydratase small subunit [Pyrinomonadaceae bacterium]